MTEERLPWFPCDAGKLLGALAGMPPDEQLVYVIVLLRIYEGNGPCPDSLDAIARRTGINKRRASDALDRLFKAKRLMREPGGIMNPKAAEILAERVALRGELSEAGTRGANKRWGKTKANQSTHTGQPKPGPLARDSDLQLELDSTPPNGGVAEPKPKREKLKTRLPENWQLSTEDFRYAESKGFHGQTVRSMAEAFKNHHHAKGTIWEKWDAAWRTWVLNEIKFNANRSGGGRRAQAGPSLVDIALGRTDNGQ